jgi:hypothetical protein
MTTRLLPAPLALAFTFTLLLTGSPHAAASPAVAAAGLAAPATTPALAVGDLVFIRVTARPFLAVAEATGSWTNHVGVVVDAGDGRPGREPLIAESTFPLARITPWSQFVARSEAGRVEVYRLATPLTPQQARRVRAAADARLGSFYDTGFNLHSRRQFCSRYVREVLAEATGTQLGEVETFAHLLARRPHTRLGFWRAWYLGAIPWQRETVTPASVLASPVLRRVEGG